MSKKEDVKTSFPYLFAPKGFWIDAYENIHDIKKTLPLHPMKNGDCYYIGVFLVGAYQETLGDLHNLFGDTNVVSIKVNEDDGGYEFVNEIKGDSVEDVLTYVEFDTKRIRNSLRKKAEVAVKESLISPNERKEILELFENGLRGYTYYER